MKKILIYGDEREVNKVIRENSRRCSTGRISIEEVSEDYKLKDDIVPDIPKIENYEKKTKGKI